MVSLEKMGGKETCSKPRIVPKRKMVDKNANGEKLPKTSKVALPIRNDWYIHKKQEIPKEIINSRKEIKV